MLTLVALMQGATYAQENLFAKFGSCEFSDCADAAASCCTFVHSTSTSTQLKSDFCMTKEQQATYQTTAYTGFYTDNLQQAWEWSCPHSPDPTDPIAELDEDVQTPYGTQAAEWMEWVLAFQYGSGLFWIFGLPVYLVLASVSFGYYNVINIYAFSSWISVQYYDIPVEGTIEQDKKVYTLANYIDFPLRKMWMYEMLAVLGAFTMVFPVSNLWSMPALGFAAFYNELY